MTNTHSASTREATDARRERDWFAATQSSVANPRRTRGLTTAGEIATTSED